MQVTKRQLEIIQLMRTESAEIWHDHKNNVFYLWYRGENKKIQIKTATAIILTGDCYINERLSAINCWKHKHPYKHRLELVVGGNKDNGVPF